MFTDSQESWLSEFEKISQYLFDQYWKYVTWFSLSVFRKIHLNKTGAINDPLSQIHSLSSSEFCFLCFAKFKKWRRTDGQHVRKQRLWVGRVDQFHRLMPLKTVVYSTLNSKVRGWEKIFQKTLIFYNFPLFYLRTLCHMFKIWEMALCMSNFWKANFLYLLWILIKTRQVVRLQSDPPGHSQ